MSSRTLITASIVVLTSIAALYVLEITFGSFMDGFYNVAYNLTATLGTSGVLPQSYNQTAYRILGYWQFFYRSVAIIIISLFVWLLRVIFVDTTGERQY